MNKGSEIKEFLKFAGTLHNLFKKLFKQRANPVKRELLYSVISEMKELKKESEAYMASLPTRFSKKYNEDDYKKDIENVLRHYTKWSREDLFLSKLSLKRIRSYEARENLEAFDQIIEREKRKAEFQRLSSQYS